jgi:carbon-monoxide dehydrogenase medium subunit
VLGRARSRRHPDYRSTIHVTRLPPFELHAPETVAEASGLLTELGEDAAIYAGGTELLLLMKLGYGSFGHLVDVKGIAELGGVRADAGMLVVGATVTHAELERSPLVRELLPALAGLERRVANLRVRNAGTLGGNLCFADPHSDPATLLLALDAELVAKSAAGARRIPVAEFVLGPYRNALEPGELLAEVRAPVPPAGTGVAHAKIAFRERPAATVTCCARVVDGRVSEARVAVGSVGPVPVRAVEAEALLAGLDAAAPAGPELDAAARAAASASGAVEDANGAVDYKQQLVRVLVARVVRDALALAG